MSYCPIALMEDIGSSRSYDDDIALEEVPFPSLSQPPTDSEGTATTTASATTSSTATKDGEAPSREPRRCSDGGLSSSDRGDVVAKMSPKRKRSADEAAGTNKHQRRSVATVSAAPLPLPPATLKDPPEAQTQTQRQGRRLTSSNESDRPTSPDDDDEIEIEELDFDSGHEHDSVDRIKTALHKYVAAVRRRKKRLEGEEEQRTANRSDADVHRSGGEIGKECAKKTTTEEVCQDDGKLPSLKQRPIQVIMSWMDTFQDHEKIQLICLQSLPTILESPPIRLAAQSDGLASIVLYDMAAFTTNSLLQLTAFHTLVVLLRPLGANEGMVHQMKLGATSSSAKTPAAAAAARSSMQRTNKSSSLMRSINKNHHHGKVSNDAVHHNLNPLLDTIHEPSWSENGVRVMLDSLRRFSSDRYLQAMGCWAMVNAALYPNLKRSLLRLGGVYAVTNAMMLHPNVEAVQFRGLFALINLVIPDNKSKKNEYIATANDGSSIHSHIYQIARLTIVAMKNFHTNKSILNRGCLVLRNLSLTPAFVKILARTPGCVDMLLHCRQVCGPRDVLVQRSARTIMILVQRAVAGEKEGGDNAGVGGALSAAFGSSPTDRPKF